MRVWGVLGPVKATERATNADAGEYHLVLSGWWFMGFGVHAWLVKRIHSPLRWFSRLRVDARWMACGALAGALGCVAAATLLSPVAIAALPMWTAIGAAVATATKAVKSVDAEPADGGTTNSAARGNALRAAALFALLLELQGRDEVAITRILDQAIAQDDATDVDALDAARRWLDDMRHRLDLALAKEGRL